MLRRQVGTAVAVVGMIVGCRPGSRAVPQPPPATDRAAIRRLLTLSGQEQRINEVASLVRARAETGARFGGHLAKPIEPTLLLEKTIDIHAKYLSDEDVIEMIRFYETATGKRLAEAQPKLVAEFMAAAKDWETELRPLPPPE